MIFKQSVRAMYFLLSFFALILSPVLSTDAAATLTQWQLNATFADQGSTTPTATGTFTFDDTSMNLADVNIATTSFYDLYNGQYNYPDNIYTSGVITTTQYFVDGNLLVSIPTLIFLPAINNFPELVFQITHPLTDTTPATIDTSMASLGIQQSYEKYINLSGYYIDRQVIDLDLRLASDPTPTPEPATMLLMGTGLTGLVAARRKKKA